VNGDSTGIDVANYISGLDATFAPQGFGYFSSSPSDFSGNQYASSEQPNLIPDPSKPSVVFESGGGAIEYVFATHIVGGDLDAVRFGSGLSYNAGTDTFPLVNTDLRISGFGYVDLYSANNAIHQMLYDVMTGNFNALTSTLSGNAIEFVGSTGADAFTGYALNDTLTGGAGNDTLGGGDGTDTANYSGARDDYTITDNGDGTWAVSGLDGSDTISDVEYLYFAGSGETLDLTVPPNGAPTDLELTASPISEFAPVGTVVGTLSATDPDSDPIDYTLSDDAGGLFEIVGNELRLKSALDYETAMSHQVTVVATDSAGNFTEETFTVAVQDEDETPPQPATITIDASGNSTGIDFEAFVRGGFLSDAGVFGLPVFDNSGDLFGEEAVFAGSTDPAAKYVLARGSLNYYFGTHTVWGELDTIEYGTRGSGSYDENGYFTGGNVELRITGLDFENTYPTTPAEEADIEANGLVHVTAAAHLRGSNYSADRVNAYADALDAYAQHFIGSDYADVYAGTSHDDIVEGGDGDDTLLGSAGDDLLKGGNGVDTADYSSASGAVSVKVSTIQQQDTGSTGIDTLQKIENLIGSAYGDTLSGGSQDNVLSGGDGADRLAANAGADILEGGAGLDSLYGGAGNDTLAGGADRDVLYGGADNDTFVFATVSDSAAGATTRDTIGDFSGVSDGGGDLIDLSGVEGGGVTLTFYDDGLFHGGSGDVRAWQTSGGNTFVEVDIDGDKHADVQITVRGLHDIVVDDLILNGALIA
jgi:Ca2+-binding RTX toxin-like protein